MEGAFSNSADVELLEQYSALLSRLTTDENLDSFSQALSELLGTPVAVLDNKLRLISASKMGEGTPEWTRLHSNGGYPHVRVLHNLSAGQEFYQESLDLKASQFRYEAFFPIFADNATNALEGAIYLVFMDEELPRRYSRLICFLGKALSWLLWRYTHMPQLQNARLNLLLTELLKGNKLSDDQITSVLHQTTFPVDRDLMLLVIETSAADMTGYTFDHLKQIFGAGWSDAYSFPFSADILILLPAGWISEASFAKERANLTEQLIACNCYAGLSGIFHSIDSSFMNQYIRALTAARSVRDLQYEERYTSYNDVALYSMVSKGPPPVSLRQLCDPALIKMVELDRHYGTQYVYTLCCYWQLNRDIPRICEYMHLHRNTLYYRLNKIKEILRQDIDDYDSFMQLNLSLNILMMYGEIPHYRIRGTCQSILSETQIDE